MTGYIYYISNTVNDKLYVGKTISSLQNRLQQHRRDSRKKHREGRPLYKAMKKYGEENFSIHLLEEVDSDLLDEREQYWIQKLNTYRYGYNATKGGDGKIVYDKSFEEKIVKEYQSGATIVDISRRYHCDTETIRKRLKILGINTRANRIVNKISVNQYDINGNFIQQFASLDDAATYILSQGEYNKLGVISHIGDVIRGKRKTCYGYIWKQAN